MSRETKQENSVLTSKDKRNDNEGENIENESKVMNEISNCNKDGDKADIGVNVEKTVTCDEGEIKDDRSKEETYKDNMAVDVIDDNVDAKKIITNEEGKIIEDNSKEQIEINKGNNDGDKTDNGLNVEKTLNDNEDEITEDKSTEETDINKGNRVFAKLDDNVNMGKKFNGTGNINLKRVKGKKRLLLIGAVSVIFIAVVFNYIYSKGTNTVAEVADTDMQDLKTSKDGKYLLSKKINELQKAFPNQDDKLWHIVRAAIKYSMLEKNPTRPGILLFASDQKRAQTSRCLAESVLTIVDDIVHCEHITVDLWKLSSLSNDEAYTKLHEYIEEGFSGEAKGALLTGLQHLSGDVALALKSYTDNENALFKKTMIITTLETLDTTELEPSSWDQVVMPAVCGLWEDILGISKAYALGSRVGNNIVVIKAEDSQILQNLGCK